MGNLQVMCRGWNCVALTYSPETSPSIFLCERVVFPLHWLFVGFIRFYLKIPYVSLLYHQQVTPGYVERKGLPILTGGLVSLQGLIRKTWHFVFVFLRTLRAASASIRCSNTKFWEFFWEHIAKLTWILLGDNHTIFFPKKTIGTWKNDWIFQEARRGKFSRVHGFRFSGMYSRRRWIFSRHHSPTGLMGVFSPQKAHHENEEKPLWIYTFEGRVSWQFQNKKTG